MRQARQAKVARVLVIGGPMADVEAVPTLAAAAALIADDDLVLVLTPGLVVDERIVAAAVAAAPALAVFADRGVERVDAAGLSGRCRGLSRRDGAAGHRRPRRLGVSTRRCCAPRLRKATPRVDLDALELYSAGRRRVVPLVWALPVSAPEARRGDRRGDRGGAERVPRLAGALPAPADRERAGPPARPDARSRRTW